MCGGGGVRILRTDKEAGPNTKQGHEKVRRLVSHNGFSVLNITCGAARGDRHRGREEQHGPWGEGGWVGEERKTS